MNKALVSIMGVAIALVNGSAWADDALDSIYSQALIPAKTALLYDECMREGFIINPVPVAEDKLRRYFDMSKDHDDVYRSRGITGKQVAETANKAINDLGKELIEHPIPLDKEKCTALQDDWARIAGQFGIK